MRASKPISVTLGKQQAAVDSRVASGAYESASEVIRAALRALDREEAAIDEIMRRKIRQSLDDPRPDIPADEVFAELRTVHEMRLKSGKWPRLGSISDRKHEATFSRSTTTSPTTEVPNELVPLSGASKTRVDRS